MLTTWSQLNYKYVNNSHKIAKIQPTQVERAQRAPKATAVGPRDQYPAVGKPPAGQEVSGRLRRPGISPEGGPVAFGAQDSLLGC